VNAVRATGGNNAVRHLIVQGFNTNIDHAISFATIPSDSASKRLMMEVHFYDPYNFTLNQSSSIWQWGKNATNSANTETWANEAYVDNQFQRLKTKYVDAGVAVIIGEFGAISRTNISAAESYRVYWNQYITRAAFTRGLVPVYWDNGYTANGGMGLFDRYSGNQVYPNLISTIVNAAK
jgi:endoglucanase